MYCLLTRNRDVFIVFVTSGMNYDITYKVPAGSRKKVVLLTNGILWQSRKLNWDH